MPSTADTKIISLPTQTEKPLHYTYLKEFRVEQCPLFVQHKCTQHKPFTCFYWHFMNQRRRRPVRKRDGTFNYSPDIYCTKFDETTGLCPDGDDCPYLHRTAGDTERRYHLRYYKTGVCVHDTDTRGYCVKNGPHCAFAHGMHDLRNPVYDIRELHAIENSEEGGGNGASGPNSLDKERNALNEDPKWQDSNYVLANYKTEPCKRPPRLCRQGYACPQYHNNRDRRRSPKKHTYRSTPCPNVKQADEWGDPANCENGENCPYCHTRTEQQFHPDIYKSTKCNDIQQTGYCPRGPFCAFAHVDKEISEVRDLGLDSTTNLAAILSNVLSPSSSASPSQSQTILTISKRESSQTQKNEVHTNEIEGSSQHLVSTTSTEATVIDGLSMDCIVFTPVNPLPTPIARPRSCSSSTNHSGDSLISYHKAPGSEREDREVTLRKQFEAIDNDPSLDVIEKTRRKQSICLALGINLSHLVSSLSQGVSLASSFYPTAVNTVESVVGNALDDLNLDDINFEASIDKELECEANPVSSSLSAGLASSGILGSSAPVNIPGSDSIHDHSRLGNLSPPVTSPLGSLPHSLPMGGAAVLHAVVGSRPEHSLDKAAAAFYGHPSSFDNTKYGHFPGSGVCDYTASQTMSPNNRVGGAPTSPFLSNVSSFHSVNSGLTEVHRLHEEHVSRTKLATMEEGYNQLRMACEAWKWQAEDASRREKVREQQRDEALAKLGLLQNEVENISCGSLLQTITGVSELEAISLGELKQIKDQLRNELDRLEKVIYHKSATKCMVCENQNRSVALLPCNHYVLCNQCALHQLKCPYCQADIAQRSSMTLPL
ncbi:RING finger protein unkempt homolog isoform X1 [Limulus polyphemus]|uniref:RING finger protein unkempt homolog isoform X1 n=1 Tax=Limulus polyphemus TaxID=6850 RepID=A0ABM1B2X7_LIMPO|nr:RING finger protein unkempt homolog isoform X1 [Limulus polyphemus]